MLQLKGKPVAETIYKRIAEQLPRQKVTPHLAVVLVGDDPASEVYVAHKQKACEQLGIKSTLLRLPETTTEKDLSAKIQQLNTDSGVHAILLQLPLPVHLDAKKMSDLIRTEKDADGLTTASLGMLLAGRQKISSCTPAGIMELLKYYKLDVAGKRALVIGRSLIVGLPLFHLLTQAHATVTVAHSRTPDLHKLVKEFDFVFVAAGKPHLLKASDFKKDAVVVDVGMHRLNEGLIGDVDPAGAEGYLKALTPVPGGVGPMTIAMLMQNTFTLAAEGTDL